MTEPTEIYEFNPRIFCLVGPSGVGKTTLLRRAVQKFEDASDFYPLAEVVSTTTRQPRAGEVEGVDYHFIDDELAAEYIETGKYIEHVEYHGNTYGYLAADFAKELVEDQNVIVIVERHGLLKLHEVFGDRIVSILITPPGDSEDEKVDTLRKRLMKTRTRAEAEARIGTLSDELKEQGFDHVLINDSLTEATGALCAIIRKESTHGY
jgi:guanylate kinase